LTEELEGAPKALKAEENEGPMADNNKLKVVEAKMCCGKTESSSSTEGVHQNAKGLEAKKRYTGCKVRQIALLTWCRD
jgi:hypothetical protein